MKCNKIDDNVSDKMYGIVIWICIRIDVIVWYAVSNAYFFPDFGDGRRQTIDIVSHVVAIDVAYKWAAAGAMFITWCVSWL